LSKIKEINSPDKIDDYINEKFKRDKSGTSDLIAIIEESMRN